jgi:peptide/nickel transport system permease protein
MTRAARRAIVLAALLVGGFCLPALLAPWLAPYSPDAMDLAGALDPPGAAHWLGQDESGSDILSRLLHGARVSLLVGVCTVLVSATAGTGVGLVAGYAGSWVEQALMRLVDVLLAFPGLLLAIALAAVLGPGQGNVIVALSVLGWTGYARVVRAQVLTVRRLDYVQAAEALGMGHGRILGRHILPNVLPLLWVQASFGLAGAILAEASLSFLGLGVPPGTPSWGGMLADGKNVLLQAPHVSIFPGVCILLAVLGCNLLGDALADWLDPRLRE